MSYAFKYGDNVDTDVIIPARYLNTSDPAELAKHCMEDIDAQFAGYCIVYLIGRSFLPVQNYLKQDKKRRKLLIIYSFSYYYFKLSRPKCNY